MGFLDRIKRVLFGEAKIKPLTPLMINAGMAARSQDFILDRLEPSIRAGFESIGLLIVAELHKVEERIIQHIDNVLQNPNLTAEQKVTELKENIVFTAKLDQIIELIKKEGQVTPSRLAGLLGIKPPTAHGHLDRLVKLGIIEEIFHGTYKIRTAKETPVLNNINIETPKEADTSIKEGVE